MTLRQGIASDGATEEQAVAAYLATTIPPGEEVRFVERAVVISEHYARLNFTTYALQEIKGTHVWQQGFSHTVIFVILGAGIVSAAVAAYLSSAIVGLAFFVVSAVIGLILHFSAPNTYVLRLTLPEGERDALMARDRDYLLRVIAALEHAKAHSS